jgi:serine/threonine protein kinase
MARLGFSPSMILTWGAKLGPYEILSPLGAGGMGEVYRARDTKLGRAVALKVLPEAFASDSQRMARFGREAQLLASLNHPNIASIYGLEDSNGIPALVMELVEGPTLAERIAGRSGGAGLPTSSGQVVPAPQTRGRPRGAPLPIDEALHMARQIAEALEYAHERGIIHRDLKPANLKLTPQGTVKILDFGLAKALDPVGAPISSLPSTAETPPLQNPPTLSVAATQAGIILGTAAYMPPEQAKGKTVDRRADIWGFGCVLYEMLTGKQAFEGEAVSDTLAAVIKDEPDWSRLPGATPPPVRERTRRCLIKDPKQLRCSPRATSLTWCRRTANGPSLAIQMRRLGSIPWLEANRGRCWG